MSLVLPCYSHTVPGSPGFKSSLNEVHLRIYHVLEATSYLSDTEKMHHCRPIARSFWKNRLRLG